MGKRKKWVYTDTTMGQTGLMRCCSCNAKIVEGEYRYYETEEAYICQCKRCGGNTDGWISRDHQLEIEKQKQWIEDANTDCKTLLMRIKQAFFEGWNSYSTPASAYNSSEEAWEESEAKRIHDTLQKLWSTQ